MIEVTEPNLKLSPIEYIDPVASPDMEPGDVELSPADMLVFAMGLHRQGKLDGAEKCYRMLLDLTADNATAEHYLGVLLSQRGDGREGLKLVESSIALDPNVASWHNNMGNILIDADRFGDAAKAYLRCTELDPANLEVLNNLGVLFRHLDRPEDSERVLKQALAINPNFAEAHSNLAVLYGPQNRLKESFSHFADALAQRPKDNKIRRLMVLAYGGADRRDEARAIILEWLANEPSSPDALHLLAAYGGADVPDRASDQYVIKEFDGFANSFDAKLAVLQYRAPALVGELVARVLGEPKADQAVLDAGCGTGLCAPFLRPYAAKLVGVDLSSKMLSRAYDRGGYDGLVQAELVAYLQTCTGLFDVIVSADTLCYFGNLTHAFAAVKQALRVGGSWIFTVEAHQEADDFKLQIHGRYTHAHSYVRAELASAGFSMIELIAVQLRNEGGAPVSGWLVLAQ